MKQFVIRKLLRVKMSHRRNSKQVWDVDGQKVSTPTLYDSIVFAECILMCSNNVSQISMLLETSRYLYLILNKITYYILYKNRVDVNE